MQKNSSRPYVAGKVQARVLKIYPQIKNEVIVKGQTSPSTDANPKKTIYKLPPAHQVNIILNSGRLPLHIIRPAVTPSTLLPKSRTPCALHIARLETPHISPRAPFPGCCTVNVLHKHRRLQKLKILHY